MKFQYEFSKYTFNTFVIFCVLINGEDHTQGNLAMNNNTAQRNIISTREKRIIKTIGKIAGKAAKSGKRLLRVQNAMGTLLRDATLIKKDTILNEVWYEKLGGSKRAALDYKMIDAFGVESVYDPFHDCLFKWGIVGDCRVELRNEFHFSGVHGAMNRSGSRAK